MQANKEYAKELRRLTKKQLIKKCKNLKLSSKGTKMQMIDRLLKKRQKQDKIQQPPKPTIPYKKFFKYKPQYDRTNSIQTQHIVEDSIYHSTTYQNGNFLIYEFFNASIYRCNFETKQWDFLRNVPHSPHIRRTIIGINSQNILYLYHHIPNKKSDQISENNAGYILPYDLNTKVWHRSIEINHEKLNKVFRRIGALMTPNEMIHILTVTLPQSDNNQRTKKKKKKRKMRIVNHLIWDTETETVISCKEYTFRAFDTAQFYYDSLYHRLVIIGYDRNDNLQKMIAFTGQLSYDNKAKCKWSKKAISLPTVVTVTKSAKSKMFYVFGGILLYFCWNDQKIYCLDWCNNVKDGEVEVIELDYKFPVKVFKGKKTKKNEMRSIFSLSSITLSEDLKYVHFIQPWEKDGWGEYKPFSLVIAVKDLIASKVKMRMYIVINGYFVDTVCADNDLKHSLPFDITQLISLYVTG